MTCYTLYSYNVDSNVRNNYFKKNFVFLWFAMICNNNHSNNNKFKEWWALCSMNG